MTALRAAAAGTAAGVPGGDLRAGRAGSLACGLAQVVVVVYAARTFLPTAYDLLGTGRPPAGQQLVASGAASALTQLLTIVLCACVLAFLAQAPALRFPALAAASTCVLLVDVLAATRWGGVRLLPPLLAGAVLLVAFTSGLDRRACLAVARRCLAPVVVGSLAVAVVLPALAKYGTVDAAWGTRDARLAGLTSQPNTLGAVAGLLCVVLLVDRLSRRSAALLLASLATLYLTQSYTSWLATAVAVAVVLSARRPLAASRSAAVALAAACGLVGVALLVVASLDVADGLGSVNGRKVLWDLVLTHWSETALLGRGPQAWGQLVSLGLVPAWAVHAHNQLLNTLFVTGLAGVAALAWLTALLVARSARSWSLGRGMGAGLVAFQLVRCYSEVPLGLFFGGVNVLVLALAGAALLADGPDRPARTAPGRGTPDGGTVPWTR